MTMNRVTRHRLFGALMNKMIGASLQRARRAAAAGDALKAAMHYEQAIAPLLTEWQWYREQRETVEIARSDGGTARAEQHRSAHADRDAAIIAEASELSKAKTRTTTATCKALARRHGVSESTIRRVLAAAGALPRRKKSDRVLST